MPRGQELNSYFQVYKSMEAYTNAKFLQDPEKKTPVFVRFFSGNRRMGFC
jgi:catalase